MKRDHVRHLRFRIHGFSHSEGAIPLTVYRKDDVKYSGLQSCITWALRKGADRIIIHVTGGEPN